MLSCANSTIQIPQSLYLLIEGEYRDVPGTSSLTSDFCEAWNQQDFRACRFLALFMNNSVSSLQLIEL
jgi:hypothetical protein